MSNQADPASAAVDRVYRSDWGRILATVIRLVGDFDLAEEATQAAFEAAVIRWREVGVPERPRAWLVQTARHAAIDRIRRAKKLESLVSEHEHALEHVSEAASPNEIPDDRLRLLFTCCHPAIALEAQVALTLRTLGGLETEEIARAFLVPPVTMAQRLVRAKKKIAAAKIPYAVPETSEMPERLHAVLTVLYLVFNEGYAATRGDSLLRADLSTEAIRLTRIVRELLGTEPPSEVTGLLALLLLQDARRDARLDAAGDVVLLEDQDRTKWDRAEIDEALPLARSALRGEPGPFALQAAIAAEHGRAMRKDETDWRAIATLYDRLFAIHPTPIVALNRAVAVAMIGGPRAGLAILDDLDVSGELDDYHLLHAARADFLRRSGALEEAAKAYERALALVGNESERRFLERRLREVRPAT